MYLVDTDVLSALRKHRRNPNVVKWIRSRRPADLYLSVVSIGEIERGIARQQRKQPAFSRELAAWLDKLLSLYRENILSLDLPACRRWGRLSAAIGHEGADLLIAATALEHGLTVATCNVKHFEPTGVSVINPFQKQ